MAGNKEYQKRANLALVMAMVRNRGPLSRIDLARGLGLDKSTITNITARLLQSSLIEEREGGDTGSRAGRRPVLLTIRPEAGTILGCEIRAGLIRGVLADMNGGISARIETDFLVDSTRPGPGIVAGVARILSWARESMAGGSELLGFGLALPAQVNPVTGVVVNSNPFRMHDYPLKTELQRACALPCRLENDANSAARGEILAAAGRGEDIRNLIFLLPEFYGPESDSGAIAGLGLGLVVDGSLCYGTSYKAGELRGHAWRPVSTNALGLEKSIVGAAPQNPKALAELIRVLTIDLKVVLSVLNPSHLFVGGRLRDQLPRIARQLESILPESGCRCLPSSYGSWEVAVGAAAGVLEELYSLPQVDNSGFSELGWEEILLRKAQREKQDLN